jgi:RNA polymerase sigma factor (sigma-70 family)
MLSDTPARTLTDEELASRAQDGCCWSFEELVRRYQVPLLHFLERWTGREEAEDLLQDTFVHAYRNLDLYEPRYRFAPWLFTIARRLSINRQRGRQPQTGGETFESVEDMQPSPAEQAAETEYRGRLWELARQVLTES